MALTECPSGSEGLPGGNASGELQQLVLWELGRQEVTVEFS